MVSLHKGFCRCAKSKLPTVMSSSSIKEREGTDLDTVSWENCFMSSPQVLLAASIFKLKILHFLWCSRVWSPTQLFTTCSPLATEPEQGLWRPFPHVWKRGSGVLSDFLVTASWSESLNQIAECVIICDDVGNQAQDLVCMQCTCTGNPIITLLTPFNPALCDKKSRSEHQTLFPLFGRIWAWD